MNRQPRWQELPPAQLVGIYNPHAAYPNVRAGMARRKADSKSARELLADNCHVSVDLRYGTGDKESLDLYQPLHPVASPASLAILIAGGYWRGGDKSDATLVVPALIDAGAVVANVNSDLCPTISLDSVVEQIIRAVRYCHRHASDWNVNPDQVLLAGHSASAPLAARVMNADASDLPANLISGVVAISGI